MSVNEVRIKKATEDFVVRGSGDPSARTFCVGDEDHTLGNAVRHVLMSLDTVDFAGYSVPHPSEPVVQIRVQTKPARKGTEAPSASETLKVACQTLSDQCSIVLERLEDLIPEVKQDRLEIERKLLDEVEAEENDDGEDEEMQIMDETEIKPDRF